MTWQKNFFGDKPKETTFIMKHDVTNKNTTKSWDFLSLQTLTSFLRIGKLVVTISFITDNVRLSLCRRSGNKGEEKNSSNEFSELCFYLNENRAMITIKITIRLLVILQFKWYLTQFFHENVAFNAMYKITNSFHLAKKISSCFLENFFRHLIAWSKMTRFQKPLFQTKNIFFKVRMYIFTTYILT